LIYYHSLKIAFTITEVDLDAALYTLNALKLNLSDLIKELSDKKSHLDSYVLEGHQLFDSSNYGKPRYVLCKSLVATFPLGAFPTRPSTSCSNQAAMT